MPSRLVDGRFRWAVGIEDTFVPQVALGRRALDEYELTQHYVFWREDLAAGATTIRYGFPWYRLEPEPGRFVWTGPTASSTGSTSSGSRRSSTSSTTGRRSGSTTGSSTTRTPSASPSTLHASPTATAGA